MTRADLEKDLLTNLYRPMVLVGLDGTTVDGTNPDLNQPIREALLMVGIVTVDPIQVRDVDVAGLAGYAYARVSMLTTIDVLKSVLVRFGDAERSNRMEVDKEGLIREESRIRLLLRDEEYKLQHMHDYGLDTVSGGHLRHHGFLPRPPCQPITGQFPLPGEGTVF